MKKHSHIRKTKEHESIVAVDATAKLIHAGLLAIGLRPGSPASFYPEFKPATGDLVAIRIRWRDDTEDHETSAQTWVKNSQTGEELDCDWIFAGSSFWKDPRTGTEYYQADAGDLVCVSNSQRLHSTFQSPVRRQTSLSYSRLLQSVYRHVGRQSNSSSSP